MSENYYEERKRNEGIADLAHFNLMRSFMSVQLEDSEMLDMSKVEYPDFFAGEYLDSNGKYHILMTEDTPDVRQNVLDRIDTDEVEIDNAKYSRRALYKLMDDLADFNNAGIVKPCACEVRDSINRVIVHLEDYTPEVMELFRKNIAGFEMLEFRSGAHTVKDEITLNAGFGYVTNSAGAGYSVGFRARNKNNDNSGFVTAGHGVTLNEKFYVNGTQIGICEKLGYIVNGIIDASWIAFSPGHAGSRTIQNYGGKEYKTQTDNGIEGLLITKSGATTGVTSGLIVSTNYISPDRGTRNLIHAQYSSAAGDSGCVVFRDSATLGVVLVGVHKGSVFNSSGARIGGCCSKASLILTDLGSGVYLY